ncbi:MAG: 5-methyltetrahydropteroyltriglutamate--homocysteine S-methyltransferase [Dehalococcoidia bacterium]
MTIATNLGFPRIGAHRELKWAMEAFWAGKTDEDALRATAAAIRKENWEFQRRQGITHVPSNDFSFYDQVLDTTAMVGAIPERYGHEGGPVDLATYFAMARGTTGDDGVQAMEMTKWFDTNYHYIVPELGPGQKFNLSSTKPIDEFLEARALGVHTRPVLIGPVTYLLSAKPTEEGFDPLSLVEAMLPVYEKVLKQLSEEGATWVQIDEPMLGMGLTDQQRAAYGLAFARLAAAAPKLKLLAAVYFSDLRDNLKVALALPIAGLHLDLVRGPGQLDDVLAKLPPESMLSVGVVDGRNIWKTDMAKALALVSKTASALGSSRVMIGPSCSLLHSPVDLASEPDMDDDMKSWMAFARQKVVEIATLAKAANGKHKDIGALLEENARAIASRRTSTRIHNPGVKARVEGIDDTLTHRASPYPERRTVQQQSIRLPAFPTTTIGSFPQTGQIRKARAAHNKGETTDAQYEEFIKSEIERSIRFQEKVGLDVLVHGEPERNDMVEYFGEQLEGYTSTRNGWVQSYGSRCVKPPIIFGDIRRTHPMTVEWSRYAQSLTSRPVKGMLTGPVTMLQWSFVRDDQPRGDTCKQIAFAIRDEVMDLEAAGIRIIQVDEPAIREGLPLRKEDWDHYLNWAVESFQVATSGVSDRTQIHTHMCYAAYDEIIDSITALDADVISMEAARSDMELLDAFENSPYPNEIGPGVYDIHSPRVAGSDEVKARLDKALRVLRPDQIWVNPDCGLKTRQWAEVEESLENMVEVAKSLR